MKKIIHRAEDRGHANHGWLNAKHSFSFANWYNPEKVQFGALRVLNDDIVAPATGFGKHPHDNMEIITIPLRGSLEHQDSMGNGSVISAGEVQVMSAGSGIFHSEKNASNNEDINLFQIWIFPNKQNVEPRYDQISYNLEGMKNNFLQVVSPNQDDEGTWIHQNAWIHLAEFEEGKALNYNLKDMQNGVYAMVIDGEIEIATENLGERDAIGIMNVDQIEFKAIKKTKVLVIEVPMT